MALNATHSTHVPRQEHHTQERYYSSVAKREQQQMPLLLPTSPTGALTSPSTMVTFYHFYMHDFTTCQVLSMQPILRKQAPTPTTNNVH